jgi:phosphoribosylformimino-5-aminoimidazole carboxamide ribotide isomerase/phosphoribosylanthranilate isomerase
VAFEVLPAIDVAGGRLVSAAGGEVRPIDAFGGSPVAAAEAFVDAGARWLHLVDVGRALGGAPDAGLVRRLSALGASVQASGGIETLAAADAALEAGASRVVLGSGMLADRESVEGAIERLGEHAVVGIEAEGETIRPRSGAAEMPLGETLAWLRSAGAVRYLYTGVGRVARLGGPDSDGAALTAGLLGHPVLVAGGVRGVGDVIAVRDLGPSVAEGVVVGRALYDGVDLQGVLAAAGS